MRHHGPVTPAPDPTATELERIAARGWQGTTVRQLGGWLLRAGGGFTGRANSVLPLSSPDLPLDEALAAVAAFYGEHGLPAWFQVPSDTSAYCDELDETLAARGWEAFNPTAVMTAPVSAVLAAQRVRADLPAVTVAARPNELWRSGYLYRGAPLPPAAVAVLEQAHEPGFASVVQDGRLLGVARGVVTEGWLGITAVTVDAGHRRRGIGTHLMGGLIAWGREHGAHSVYLQVDEANTTALAMYAAQGFTRHHGYHYRRQLPRE